MNKLQTSKNKELTILNKVINVSSTSLAWALILGVVTWVIGALGWYAVGTIWNQHLFVPQSVRSTAVTVLLLSAWLLILFALFSAWKAYNQNRYFRNNKRSIEPLRSANKPIEWAEITIDPEEGNFLKGEQVSNES